MSKRGFEDKSFMDKMYKMLKDSPMIILVWVFFVAMLVFGGFVFYEDTLSSKFGNEWIAQAYGVIPFSNSMMGWIVALVPQIAQIAGSYILLAYSGENLRGNDKGSAYVKMALVMTPVFLMIDVGSDIFYRSNQLSSPLATAIGVVYSLTYYTIGSEFFLTLGFTFASMLMFPALGQVGRVTARIIGSVINLVRSFKAEMVSMKGSYGRDHDPIVSSGNHGFQQNTQKGVPLSVINSNNHRRQSQDFIHTVVDDQ